MPRDISGNYTLPAGNPVVSGTVIATTWANPTLSDVGQNLTDSLDRFGRGGMLAALRLTDGSAVVPALAWSSETGTGLYRVGAGVVGMSVLAVEVSRWSVAQQSNVLGSVTAPSYAFTGDLNTGMYSPGADQLGLSTAGALRLSVAAAGNVIIAAPSSGNGLRVDGDIQIRKDTGSLVFRNAADTLNVGFMQFSNSGSAILSVTGAQDLAIQTNSSTRVTVTSAGNVTIAQPSSGTGLTINAAPSASAALSITSTAGAISRPLTVSGSTTALVAFIASNTSGACVWGIEGSAGGEVFVGTSAYAAVFGTNTASAVNFATNTINRLTITSDGRVFGTALHNNAGSVTGTTNQYLASGTYTPTVTNGGNTSALSAGLCQWLRVGNVVTVSGSVTFSVTSATTATTVEITLPIATDITATSNLGGAGVRDNTAIVFLAGHIKGNVATNLANFSFRSDANTGSQDYPFSFTYLIL